MRGVRVRVVVAVLVVTLAGLLTGVTGPAAADGAPRIAAPEGMIVSSISSGDFHTCGVRTDATVACWGVNGSGQSIPPAGTFTSVGAGDSHTCGVRTDATVACWGVNGSGQSIPPAGTFTSVTAGNTHTCGVRTDATVACWGNNLDGRATPPAGTFTQVSAGRDFTCGVRTDTTLACWGRSSDGRTTPPAGTFTSVSAGSASTCGLRTDATVACWGESAFGRTTPPAGTFTSVAAGNFHTCGVRTDATVACWGDGGFGRATPPAGTFTSVGAGDTHTCGVRTDATVACWGFDDSGRTTPRAGTFSAAAVSAGGAHTCGVRTDGTLACWGLNNVGQSVAPAGTFTSVNTGFVHTCGVRTGGTVACWGGNSFGEAVPPAGTFTSVGAGISHSCGLRTDGTVACWGYGGTGLTSPPAGTFTSLSAGNEHNCGLRADATVACWGQGFSGQASPPGGAFLSVSAGVGHTCGVRADATLACWGSNTHGQTTAPSGTFVSVSAGSNHTCGVRTDGTLACWGNTGLGQTTPPAGTFTSVSAGGAHTCGVRTDGTVACWGANGSGEANPSFIGASPPAAARGVAYSHTFTTTFESPASTVTLFAGTMPPGLSMSPDGTLSMSGTPTTLGTFNVRVCASNGLAPVACTDVTLTVNLPELLVQGPALSKAYGAPVPALPPTYVGLVLGDTAPETPATCSTTATAASPIGSYPITCSGAADADYTISYSAGTLVVNAAALTVQAPSLSKAYGAAVPALTPSYVGLAPGETAPPTPATCTTTATASSPAGTYQVTCSGAAGANYAISYATGTLTVTKAELTVQGPSAGKTYGAAVPALPPTYVGLVNGDSAPTTAATCSTAATAASPVGSYPVTCAGAADANYTISYSPGSLVVHGAELVVAGPSLPKTYGAALPALTPTYVGLVNGDTKPATGATCTTTASASSDNGAYPTTCSGAADANYVIVYAPGTLTVTKAALTVQAPSPSKSYGATVPALAPSYVGLVNGDTALDTPATCSTSATTASDAGTYPVTCSGATDANYEISYATGTLTVTKAQLTVGADDQTRPYGQPNPAFTVSYSGFVLGQTPATAGVTGAPACTTTATPASAPGGYAITCTAGTLASTNYSFTFDPGTLTVVKAETELTAQPVSLVRSLLSTTATMRATLRPLPTGQPLAGQTVNFTLAGRSCSATTDATGTASCGVSVVSALLGLSGYTATYAGNANYTSSSANGRVTLL